MQGLATGNRNGKTAERKQEILTPHVIRRVVHAVWPHGIALDPAGHELSIMGASNQYLLANGDDGLKKPWVPFTYINPPFKTLKAWISKGLHQPKEQIWLVPNRTSRYWFRAWRNLADAFVELDPFPFHGYKEKAPFALILVYFGNNRASFIRESRAHGIGQVWYRGPEGEWRSHS